MIKEGHQLQDTLSRTERNKLVNYVKRRQNQKSHLLLYTSAMQDNIHALSAMGYKYYRGVMLPMNCVSASLYYLQAVRGYYD